MATAAMRLFLINLLANHLHWKLWLHSTAQ
jgi:hypothetical protein